MIKGRRFIRQRVDESDTDNENDPSEENKTVSNESCQKNNKGAGEEKNKLSRVSTTCSILSFDIEEEGDESFKIKKSSHNKKVVKQLRKSKKSTKSEESNFTYDHQEKKEEDKIQNKDFSEEDDSENDADIGNKKTKNYSDILKNGGIPDANLIHLLKQKRQKAKSEDFIAFDNTATSGKSRLVREDDNDASDDEGGSNSMSSVSQKNRDLERRRIEESILIAQDETDSEKEQGWEEVQMKKAMSDSLYASEHKINVQSSFNSNIQTFYNQINGQLISATQKSLKQKLFDVDEQYRLNKQDQEELQNRIKLNLCETNRLCNNKQLFDDKYHFYQQMQSFVLDFIDCMNEKMSSITYLERCMTQLQQQRAERLVARRHADVADQSVETQAGMITGPPNSEDPLEEAKKRRKAEREGRRARRRRARSGKKLLEHRDGWSTDEELTYSEENKFKNEKERLVEGCKSCMDDVLEQFHSVPLILSRFSEWKSNHYDSYSDAYIGLCLSRLLTPLIRLQLITWNPLETYCKNFEKSSWFLDLLNYGPMDLNTKQSNCNENEIPTLPLTNSNTNNDNVNETKGNGKSNSSVKSEEKAPVDTKLSADPDKKLLPNVIDKILVNKITGVVENIWDPLSSEQSKNLRKVVGQVLSDYSLYIHDSKHISNLIAAINNRLVKSIDSDLFIPLCASKFIEDRNNPLSSFFFRQLHVCLKEFCNTLLWQGVLSDQHLQILALDRILNRYLVTAIQSAPLTTEIVSACQCIASSVPEEWFSEYLEGVCIPQLNQFCKLIVSLAQKAHASASADSKSHVVKLGEVLLQLHADSHVAMLSSMIPSTINLD